MARGAGEQGGAACRVRRLLISVRIRSLWRAAPIPPPLQRIALQKRGATAAFSFLIVRSSVFSVATAVFRHRMPNWTDRSFLRFFLRCAALTLWNRWKDALRECAKAIPLGNFPASRPSGNAARQRGRHRRAASLGSMARRKRRVEPDGVRPSSPGGAMGGARDGGSDGRSAAAGRKAGRFPPVSSFASFGGVGWPLQAHFGR